MKKSALILSLFVIASSVTPIVAIQNQQNSNNGVFSRIFQNIFRTDLLADMFGNFGRAVDSFTMFRSNIDTLVGDRQDNSGNQTNFSNQASQAFNGVAQNMRDNLRRANVPGMERVVNDNNMSLIKLALLGIGSYVVLRIAMNMFAHEANA